MRIKPQRTRGTGGLVRKKGSRFWYALWWQNGRQHCVSTKTDSKMRAEAKLQEVLGQKAIGKQPATDLAKLRYEDLRDSLLLEYRMNGRKSLRYKAKGGAPYISNLKHLDGFFANHRVPAINPDTIRQFVLGRQADTPSNATINRELSALKRMFSLAVKDGKLLVAPYIALLKEPPPRKGFLELGEFPGLLQQLPDYLRAPVTVAYYTGMRLGEIRSIKWESVDFVARTIRLCRGSTKNDEPRIIPMDRAVWRTLSKLDQTTEFVFGNGKQLGQFRKSWRAACVRAGLGKFETLENGAQHYVGLTFHDLRRSGVRNLIRAGVSEQVAMRISGHKTASIFRRYNIISETDLRQAAAKMDAWREQHEGMDRKVKIGESLMKTGARH